MSHAETLSELCVRHERSREEDGKVLAAFEVREGLGKYMLEEMSFENLDSESLRARIRDSSPYQAKYVSMIPDLLISTVLTGPEVVGTELLHIMIAQHSAEYHIPYRSVTVCMERFLGMGNQHADIILEDVRAKLAHSTINDWML